MFSERTTEAKDSICAEISYYDVVDSQLREILVQITKMDLDDFYKEEIFPVLKKSGQADIVFLKEDEDVICFEMGKLFVRCSKNNKNIYAEYVHRDVPFVFFEQFEIRCSMKGDCWHLDSVDYVHYDVDE